MKILVNNIHILPMTGEGSFINNGYVVIEDQNIATVGSGKAPEDTYERIIDGSGKVILPGFVNTHTHAAMTLLRGYADDLPLMEWLETKIWPLENKMTAEDMYWGSKLAILEMIKSGTTTFNDMYMFMDETARAVEETGIRAVLSRGLVGAGPEADSGLEQNRELFMKWHGAAEGRISIMMGPHAPYTCPPDYLERVLGIADEFNMGIHIHLSETAGELNDIKARYGKTPVGLMEEIGLFKRKTIAAHCVHLVENDIEILKQNNVGVAHNPESNMKLASGIAPVPEMLSAGIAVGLGTDGASSNNNLDMLQEMRSAAFLHKVNKMDPMVVPAYQALEMATSGGAKVLGLDNIIGRIEQGLKADLIIVDLNKAHCIPVHDVVSSLVYSSAAADVDTVIVNGKILMENREVKIFNEKETLQAAEGIVEKLLARE